MRQAGQVAQHHAEAVVQRHRNAQPVGAGQAHRLADEEAVVQDIAVRQRRALREAGGAAGELDVDRVVGVERGGDLRQPRILRIAAGDEIVEAQHAGHLLLAQMDHGFQVRQARRNECARRAAGQFRRQRLDHLDIVAVLEFGHRDQGLAADLVDRVFQFRQAVGGIDVDQHHADLGGRELGQQPLRIVVRPDADPVAALQAQIQQCAGQPPRFGLQFAVGIAQLLMAGNQRLAVRHALHHRVEKTADGLLDQRQVACAMVMADR